MTVGSAGGLLDEGFEMNKPWTANFMRGTYGYGRVTIVNSSALHFEYIEAGRSGDVGAGDILDDVWVHRER